MGCEALVKYVRCVCVCIYIWRDQYQHFIICYLLQAENQIMSMSNHRRIQDFVGGGNQN